ncbi:MAG: TonB-dependent receptor, partial [Mucilaginibacter sp.]|nr:TonB-dependent receptor [Mucilaginibacter sp.]
VNQTINQFYTGLAVSLDLSTQKDSLYSYNNSIVRANPYIKFQGENYKIDAGVNIVDEFGFASRYSIFPAAKLEYQVIPKYVRVFVEAKGDVNKSSLRDFFGINPFLGKNLLIQNSVDKLDLSAGLKGTLAPGLGFKADVFRNSVKNMPLFVNDFVATGNRFTVIYDNGNATVSGFNGELDYKASGDVDVFGRVEFKDYKMATEAQAWNLPKFKLTAGTAFTINDKVKVTGSLVFRGSSYDRTYGFTVTTAAGVVPAPGINIIDISSFADLSGSVEYKVNKQISIFGRVNNILNSTNQTWVHYPDYGFNIFGGASFSF